MANRCHRMVWFVGVLPLWLLLSGCRSTPVAAAPPIADQAQAAELRQFALEQARAYGPKIAQPYAEQWAAGIGQAVIDTGKPLSERRMAALRAAISESVRERPHGLPPEHYAWLAAASRYHYRVLAQLPDLTPDQERQLDQQVDDLGRYLAHQVKATMMRVEPSIAQDAADVSQAEFAIQASKNRANPNGQWLKRPLTSAEMALIKNGFDQPALETSLKFIIPKADPDRRLAIVKARAPVSIWMQFAAITPRTSYPPDMEKLSKEASEAFQRQLRPN